MRGELFAGDRPFYITIPEAAILIDEEANKW